MKTKLLRKLREKAKKKILLYQTSEDVYKITSPYSYKKDIFMSRSFPLVERYLLEERRNYILVCIQRIRKKKIKQEYPKLINI